MRKRLIEIIIKHEDPEDKGIILRSLLETMDKDDIRGVILVLSNEDLKQLAVLTHGAMYARMR